ncbi:response regulator transcription factor [Streptomyces sp. NPDC004959]|uniref:response regulator transcription factor n=1 Tax=unclassified Streptomyces TaxID=2593676 RepID=UPI00068C2A29|nr:response regulator transcription factor [Streptomyces sp. NRRL F-5630]
MKVLVVEDEPLLARALQVCLRRDAMTVDATGDGGSALEMLELNDYDAMVLDRDIPVVHGDEVCRRAVRAHPGVGVLMLTAAGRLHDRVEGLRLGADDYLAKPFEFPELIARLRAISRRTGPRLPTLLRAGDLSLDPFTRQVSRSGAPVSLTNKEFAVLEQLLRAGGAVLSAEELLAKAWDRNADPFTNSPRVVISTLRRKLGRPWPIETVPGAGYRIRPGQTSCPPQDQDSAR